MPEERFGRLEGEGSLPGDVREALSRINRFDRLEIGSTKTPPQPLPEAAPKGQAKTLCLHCGQPNERERETCWACFRYVKVRARPSSPGEQDITLVLDGNTYRSGDTDIPEDVRALMDRIRKEGYSQRLLTDWRSWRATHRSRKPREAPPAAPAAPAPRDEQETRGDDASGIKVFRGQRVSVIRMNDKVYTSDDKDLPPELRRLFEYIDQNGVTPALMDYLRQFGDKVKYRPATTADPTDGDVDFWKQAAQTRQAPAAQADPAREISRRQAEMELETAERRYQAASSRMWGAVATLVPVILYILLNIFARTR